MKYGAADAVDAASARRVAYLIGPDGRVLRAWPRADVRTFADEVLALL